MTRCRAVIGCYLAVPVPAGQVQRGVGVEHAAIRRVLKDELIMLKVIPLTTVFSVKESRDLFEDV